MPPPPPPPPLKFYSPTSSSSNPPPALTTLLQKPDTYLESSHTYIQHLFPLPEPSPFNPSAPIITPETCHAFRSSEVLRGQLRMSLGRMLEFYGFSLSQPQETRTDDEKRQAAAKEEAGHDTTVVISPSTHFRTKSANWLRSFNHNHLRITRILRSCRVLGLGAEAQAFYTALTSHPEVISKVGKTSLMYWSRAATRPLYLAPEDDEGDGGREWLREWEEREGGKEG
ncbi:MAG: hypothetical protein Q9220_003155 [cf. Caloplaca sp. 1 TL-2023]